MYRGIIGARRPCTCSAVAQHPASVQPCDLRVCRRGVLFLDLQGVRPLFEAPEFHRDVLDALRQPLESGQVVIARAGAQAVFPARFTLVLAANPCPCAKNTGPGKAGCSCSPAARRRYLARLSGPLLDRVDVKVRLQPVSRSDRHHPGDITSDGMTAG